MVHRYFVGSLLLLVSVGVSPAVADAISFTGNTQTDFSTPNTIGNYNYTGETAVTVMQHATDIGEAPFITANGWVSGWAINSVEMSYNAVNNTMYVGLDSFKNAAGQRAIFGDADGNGNPGGASPQMAAMGGLDPANMGGDKSVAIAFAAFNPSNPSAPGATQIIAGIPADKTLAGSGIDGFAVDKLNPSTALLQNAFGSAISGVSGNLAFNPSSAHPELEFSISNFNKSGIDPTKGFWIELYAGSGQDVVAGEAGLIWTWVPPVEPQEIPEPTTLLVWTGLAGGMAWGFRRSRRLPS
jgi:hypothetical protein